MAHISRLDPNRETVGSIYRQAQLYGERQIITGDMNYEMRLSLCADLNDTIKEGTKDFNGKPFYITVYEKRDLAMKNAFHRELTKTKYRPYPEPDTVVFKIIPSSEEVYFCWYLPQRAHMINELNCPDLYPVEQLSKYRRWENFQLEYFGFMKNDEGNWVSNPFYAGDELLTNNNPKISLHMT